MRKPILDQNDQKTLENNEKAVAWHSECFFAERTKRAKQGKQLASFWLIFSFWFFSLSIQIDVILFLLLEWVQPLKQGLIDVPSTSQI